MDDGLRQGLEGASWGGSSPVSLLSHRCKQPTRVPGQPASQCALPGLEAVDCPLLRAQGGLYPAFGSLLLGLISAQLGLSAPLPGLLPAKPGVHTSSTRPAGR